LYAIALAYPVEPSRDEQVAARNFLYSLVHLLPCSRCRHNYNKKLADWAADDIEVAVSSSEAFVAFLFKLESAVALSAGKSAPVFEKSIRLNVGTEVPAARKRSGIDAHFMWLLIPAVAVGVGVTWATLRHKKLK